ncbi:response regulator transcription factor [Spirochaeta cellobiosiphila]|uniref:response regulator transcription factor n=1 Tax=Spirochaeta cellobiosiphila TaxID=504483 RepID=UPI00041F426C|nr:response regulator transcription factor [Spirochaeta cellobiosiphila]
MNLLIVDDQILFAESLKTVLENRTNDMKVIAIGSNGMEAIELNHSYQPDIILMDIRMPGMNGVESIKHIKSFDNKTCILVLTTFEDDEYIYSALNNGAAGYILKDTPPEELIQSIRAAYSGVIQLSKQIMPHLMIEKRQKVDQGLLNKIEDLSKREREVLKLLGTGKNNKEISEMLYLAEQTVKNHVSLIYSKLNIHDRYKAIEISQKLFN